MFIRRSLVLLFVFASLGLLSQNKTPVSKMGSAPLSSSCIVTELPPDQPDTVMHIHPEPEEPGEKDPLLFLHKRRLPNPSWSNYYRDQGRGLSKTNSGSLQLGAQGTFSVYNLGTPPDNTMAISNEGKIVAAINVKIGFYDSTGARLTTNDPNIATFISDPSISQSSLFDPRLIYDPVADRFIFVVLSGSTDATSKVVIGFSQTKNPQGAWKFYTLTGNFDGSTSWFDYPNIALTDDELIITGNLFFSPSNNYNQSVILQINKAEGYSGGASLNFKSWYNIQDATGNYAITIVPAVNGINKSYGPNFYLVSNSPPSESVLTYYEITNKYNVSTSQLVVKTINTDFYSTPPANAQQKGTGIRLDVMKNRIRSAYVSNGLLHYTYITPTNTSGTLPALAYGRYDVSTGFNRTIYIAEAGFNSAFPAIMHFSNLENKEMTLLAYLSSNTTIFPEVRALTIDENMVPSASILVKAGTGYIFYNSGNPERWGDYTGIARKYNSVRPEVWVFGCHGDVSHAWANNISQITAGVDVESPVNTLDSFYFSPNPTVRFLNLNVLTTDTASFRLKIFTMKGQLVRDEVSVIPSGKHGKTYDLSGLSPETYILKLSKNETTYKPIKIILLGK
jgi:hypothetical protein